MANLKGPGNISGSKKQPRNRQQPEQQESPKPQSKLQKSVRNAETASDIDLLRLQKQALGIPADKSPPPSLLLDLVTSFLSEYGFQPTCRMLEVEREAKGAIPGWEAQERVTSSKKLPSLQSIFQSYYMDRQNQSNGTTNAGSSKPTETSSKNDKTKDKYKRPDIHYELDDSSSSSSAHSKLDSFPAKSLKMLDKKPIEPKIVKAGQKAVRKSSVTSSSGSSESDADDEAAPKLARGLQKHKIDLSDIDSRKAKVNIKEKAVAKLASSSGSSSSEEDSSSGVSESDENEASKSKQESSDSEESGSSGSEEDSEASQMSGIEAHATPSVTKSTIVQEETVLDLKVPNARSSVHTQVSESSVTIKGSTSPKELSESVVDSSSSATSTTSSSSDDSDEESDEDSVSASKTSVKEAAAASSSKTATIKVSPEEPILNGSKRKRSASPLPPTNEESASISKKQKVAAAIQKKASNEPFSRIPKNIQIDQKLSSNAYVPYDYAENAHKALSVTKGKGFTKEKNKKKRGSYRGGFIDIEGKKGIKFED